MKTLLRTAASTLLAFAAVAHAHPGHDAPVVHAHDLDEAIAMAGVILVAGLVGAALVALRRSRARARG